MQRELEGVNRWDLGGVLGIAVALPTRSGTLGLDCRYSIGFLPILDSPEAPDVKNSGVTLTTFYSHRIGKH
jgi:hypothetical protein